MRTGVGPRRVEEPEPVETGGVLRGLLYLGAGWFLLALFAAFTWTQWAWALFGGIAALFAGVVTLGGVVVATGMTRTKRGGAA